MLAAFYVAGPVHAAEANAPPVAPAPAAAQAPKVNKMTIEVNGVSTVYYTVQYGSPRLQVVYRTLQYAENEMTVVEQLQQLKLDYVRNERNRVSGAGANNILGWNPYGANCPPPESTLQAGVSQVLANEATPRAALQAIQMLQRAEADATNELKQLAPKDRQALGATAQQLQDFAAQNAQ